MLVMLSQELIPITCRYSSNFIRGLEMLLNHPEGTSVLLELTAY